MTSSARMNPTVEPVQCVTTVAKREGKLPPLRMRCSISLSLSDGPKRPRRRGADWILMAVRDLRDRSCHHRNSEPGNGRNDSGGFGAIDAAGQAHLHAFWI